MNFNQINLINISSWLNCKLINKIDLNISFLTIKCQNPLVTHITILLWHCEIKVTVRESHILEHIMSLSDLVVDHILRASHFN